jgi:hypothetical protein
MKPLPPSLPVAQQPLSMVQAAPPPVSSVSLLYKDEIIYLFIYSNIKGFRVCHNKIIFFWFFSAKKSLRFGRQLELYLHVLDVYAITTAIVSNCK